MTLDEPLRLASADQTDEFYTRLRSRHERFAINTRLFSKYYILRGKEALLLARAQVFDSMLGEVPVTGFEPYHSA